ncbi:MAG: cysteine--tRNA ligase [Bacilli bacterium]
MQLYNTLTRKKEEFIPYEEGKVGFYTCGPTVYHYAHIGNMRNYIGHDVLDKTLRYLGYDVTRVMNITDVGHLKSDSDSGEDKMVASAKKEHKTVMDIAKYYTDAFFKDFDAINCRRPDIISPATDNIDEYIKIISKLLKDGYAYQAGGNVYFDVSKIEDYYKLTNHKEDDMVVGVREGVDFDSNKKNQADFALWFTKSKFDDQDLKWDSPFGVGYPGWHIECSGISLKYLGEHLDIHGGGVDNIFPHHTNEIAQSEAYLGHKWCNYWFHNEHLMDESGKMSKSKGTVLSVSVLTEEGYNPLAFRFMCLQSHYRKQLIFSYDVLKQVESQYDKLRNKISLIKDEGELDKNKFDSYNDKFINYLSNDLNTANAITLLYDLIKDDSVNGHTKLELIKSFDMVFSLDLIMDNSAIDKKMETYILGKIEERREAKLNKNYELSDSIRAELLDKGIELIDTREGTTYKIIK